MRHRASVRLLAVALALVVATSATVAMQPRSAAAQEATQGHGLTGTWYWTVPSVGAAGFYSYAQDGTVTGVASLIAGTANQPTPGSLHSSDYGTWRHDGGGFESLIFRMRFDPVTGDILSITRVRTLFELDAGRNSTFGTFFVAQWVCLTPVTCPDPAVDPPTVPEFAPPGNTWTQTRVRFP